MPTIGARLPPRKRLWHDCRPSEGQRLREAFLILGAAHMQMLDRNPVFPCAFHYIIFSSGPFKFVYLYQHALTASHLKFRSRTVLPVSSIRCYGVIVESTGFPSFRVCYNG